MGGKIYVWTNIKIRKNFEKIFFFPPRFLTFFFRAHWYYSEQYSAHLFFASITAQISFSANRSTIAKNRILSQQYRSFALVLRFALKEIWAVIEAKNRYFSAHRYCSEQYRCALKKIVQKISAKKFFFQKFFWIFIFVHAYILPPTGQRYGLKVVTQVL